MTTRAVLSWDKIIQDETLNRIAVEEILVQEMAKSVAAEDKDHDDKYRRKHADHETRWEKHASNILIQNEKNKAHDIMEEAQFMMKKSHSNWWSRQRGLDLVMFFQKNERQLEKRNHDKVVSHLHTKYSQKNINTKEHHDKVVDNIQTKDD